MSNLPTIRQTTKNRLESGGGSWYSIKGLSLSSSLTRRQPCRAVEPYRHHHTASLEDHRGEDVSDGRNFPPTQGQSDRPRRHSCVLLVSLFFLSCQCAFRRVTKSLPFTHYSKRGILNLWINAYSWPYNLDLTPDLTRLTPYFQ